MTTRNEAYVEDFTTYFAVCEDCRWEGKEHEDNRQAAQAEADEHVCAPAEGDADYEAPDGIMPPPMFEVPS